MSIVKNFQDHLKPAYYYELKNVDTIKLVEKKGNSYTVDFIVSSEKNHFFIIQDLEDLKMKDAKYLIHKPQDCDYIILDLLKKIVYFVELKDTKVTNVDFMGQLVAGERWLSHLLFCCKCEDDDFILENEDWEIKRIGIRYQKARPSRNARSKQSSTGWKKHKDVKGKELFTAKGKYFYLDEVRRMR